MLEVTIPGREELHVEHLVLDFNGTLACDGALLEGVAERLNELATQVRVHVLTADTFGTVQEAMAGVQCEVAVLPAGAQDEAKREYVRNLGPGRVVAIGNGRNDCLMVAEATLGIVVVQEEGAAVATLMAADVAVPGIQAALDLLRRPLRLKATLRT